MGYTPHCKAFPDCFRSKDFLCNPTFLFGDSMTLCAHENSNTESTRIRAALLSPVDLHTTPHASVGPHLSTLTDSVSNVQAAHSGLKTPKSQIRKDKPCAPELLHFRLCVYLTRADATVDQFLGRCSEFASHRRFFNRFRAKDPVCVQKRQKI